MRPAYLFIRDDDVKAWDRPFRAFSRMLLKYRLPVVYAVIPGRMDARLVTELKERKTRTPELLDIVQHGWDHADHSRPGEDKYEFGPSRSARLQRMDLAHGMSAMKKAFGKMFMPVFVPPFHGADKATLKMVKELGFIGFSGGRRVFSAKAGILDFPVGISFGARCPDGKKMGHGRMLARLARAVAPGKLTGLLFHHQDFAAPGVFAELDLFFRGLSRWRDKGGVKIILLSDILSRRSSC